MEIEAQIKQLEAETDFEKLVDNFSAVTKRIKQNLDNAKVIKGKITEIIREGDKYIEKEFKA
jgi:hypothetical protein